MAADTNFLSTSITALDATPLGLVSAGLGAKDKLYSIKDYASPTAVGLQTVGSYYRLVRIPTNAIINELFFFTDRALDSNAANTLAFVMGVAFSDCPGFDGTQPYQLGQIPTTANNGTVTTFATFASPNNLFGTITAANMGHTAAYFSPNLLFNGGNTAGPYTWTAILGNPLWNLFGFTDGRGLPDNPGGMFDIYAYVSVVAATGVAGNLGCICTFNL
jgi:hypothetical protein